MFAWRKLASQGALTATAAEEEVVAASEYRALHNQVQVLQCLVGKKTMEAQRMNRIIKDATVSVYQYDDLASLKAYVLAIVTAYNFAKPCCRLPRRGPFIRSFQNTQPQIPAQRSGHHQPPSKRMSNQKSPGTLCFGME